MNLKDYYKNIRERIINKKIENEKEEKYFRIEVIASIFDNRYICDEESSFTIGDEIGEFCSYITGEKINLSSFLSSASEYYPQVVSLVKELLLEQYPDFKPYTYPKGQGYNINEVINWYRSTYGKYLLIFPPKKGYLKTLKLQEK